MDWKKCGISPGLIQEHVDRLNSLTFGIGAGAKSPMFSLGIFKNKDKLDKFKEYTKQFHEKSEQAR